MNIGAGIESLYLDGPASGFSEKAKNVAIAFVLNLIWIQVVMLFGQWLYGADINYGISTIFQFDFERNLRLEIFSACIFAPIVEEAIFRFAPMRISDALGRDFFLPIAIISQVIFGAYASHGDRENLGRKPGYGSRRNCNIPGHHQWPCRRNCFIHEPRHMYNCGNNQV